MDFEDRLSMFRSRVFGRRDLWRAARIGDVKAIERLIARGADLNQRRTTLSFEGEVPLHQAVQYEHVEAVKALIRLGANVNARDHSGMTPLMFATTVTNSLELVNILIAAGADVKDQDKGGKSALDWAAFYGKVDVIKLLLDQGADPNIARGNRISAPVGWAVMSEHSGAKHLDAIKLLLARGANVDAPQAGDPALHTASLFRKVEFVKLLIEAGANPNRRNSKDATALISAAIGGNVDIIKMLMAAGADVNAENKYGETALDCAYDRDRPEAVRFLEQAGAKRGSGHLHERPS